MNSPICTGSNRKIKYGICFAFLIALLVILFTVSVCVGSVNISLAEILSQFTGEQDELYATVLFVLLFFSGSGFRGRSQQCY